LIKVEFNKEFDTRIKYLHLKNTKTFDSALENYRRGNVQMIECIASDEPDGEKRKFIFVPHMWASIEILEEIN